MNDRQVLETVARCVSTLVYYHNCERTRQAEEQMAAEIQTIADHVEGWGLKSTEVARRVIRPVGAELIERDGHEVGPRILDQFVDAFEGVKAMGR